MQKENYFAVNFQEYFSFENKTKQIMSYFHSMVLLLLLEMEVVSITCNIWNVSYQHRKRFYSNLTVYDIDYCFGNSLNVLLSNFLSSKWVDYKLLFSNIGV